MSKYPNSGTLGRNTRKEKDSHPDFSGQCEIDGVGYWISAWIKEGQGSKFFSLSFKPKEEKAAKPKGESWRAGAPDDMSDVPF